MHKIENGNIVFENKHYKITILGTTKNGEHTVFEFAEHGPYITAYGTDYQFKTTRATMYQAKKFFRRETTKLLKLVVSYAKEVVREND